MFYCHAVQRYPSTQQFGAFAMTINKDGPSSNHFIHDRLTGYIVNDLALRRTKKTFRGHVYLLISDNNILHFLLK